MTNAKAVAAFNARKDQIEKLLARIAAFDAATFNVPADQVHWGHVGDVSDMAQQLQLISDRLYREGEHAPE